MEVIDLVDDPHPGEPRPVLKPTNGLWLPGHVDREAPEVQRVWKPPHRLIVCRAAVPAREVQIWLPGALPGGLDQPDEVPDRLEPLLEGQVNTTASQVKRIE